MVPVWAIPLLVQVGSKLIDMAFRQLEKKCPADQSKALNKIEENDKKNLEKYMGESK